MNYEGQRICIGQDKNDAPALAARAECNLVLEKAKKLNATVTLVNSGEPPVCALSIESSDESNQGLLKRVQTLEELVLDLQARVKHLEKGR